MISNPALAAFLDSKGLAVLYAGYDLDCAYKIVELSAIEREAQRLATENRVRLEEGYRIDLRSDAKEFQFVFLYRPYPHIEFAYDLEVEHYLTEAEFVDELEHAYQVWQRSAQKNSTRPAVKPRAQAMTLFTV